MPKKRTLAPSVGDMALTNRTFSVTKVQRKAQTKKKKTLINYNYLRNKMRVDRVKGKDGRNMEDNWEKFTAQLGSKIFLTGQQEEKTECHSKMTLCHLHSLGHAVCDIRGR